MHSGEPNASSRRHAPAGGPPPRGQAQRGLRGERARGRIARGRRLERQVQARAASRLQEELQADVRQLVRARHHRERLRGGARASATGAPPSPAYFQTCLCAAAVAAS